MLRREFLSAGVALAVLGGTGSAVADTRDAVAQNVLSI